MAETWRTIRSLAEHAERGMSLEAPTASGQTLGRYVLGAVLGQGGMGAVYRAWDPELGREVALKLLHRADIDRAELERFVAEARITSQLEHPHIVPVHDVGITDDKRVYYVMKRIDGRSLEAVLRGGAGGPLPRLLSIFLDVCDAIAYAHHRGVVHQDLKPDNVMIGAFGEVLVLDWGLATLHRAGLDAVLPAADAGQVMGTPGYIAPERIAAPRQPIQPAADQWALGAILYAIISGHRAVEGHSARAVLDATVAGDIEDVRFRDLDREVPDALADICMQALAADPAERFAAVSALAGALRSFMEGSERRARALAKVSEADAMGPAIAETLAQADALAQQAQALLAPLKSWSPLADKAAGWKLEDASRTLRMKAGLDEVIREQHLRAALSLVPDLHEAHKRLAAQHRAALEAAEADRDELRAAREAWLLRHHDRGHHRRWLSGEGRIVLHTDPPGAAVTIARVVEQDRRLVEVDPRPLGTTPLDVMVPPGSYVLTIRAQGRMPVRYPVFLTRAGEWGGVRPGESAPFPIWLPPAGTLTADEVYVPAGWFTAGGDPNAPDSLSRRRVWVDAFLMQRFPVTNDVYARFLDGLSSPEAERLVPRDKTLPEHLLDGTPLMVRGVGGRFGPVTKAEGWADQPVIRIDLARARTYASLLSGWRLPDELEWEKAARGVDGRHYPWGDSYDPGFANGLGSFELPGVVTTRAFETDCSVYGVRGLGGNARDLCGNEWLEEGSAQDGERLQHEPAKSSAEYVSVRGGAWNNKANYARAATRFGDPPQAAFDSRSLRLVCATPEASG